MKMKMELTGPGVYLMNGWGKMPIRPKEALVAITRSLRGRGRLEKTAALIIRFSVTHNAWCGVSWPRLIEEIREEGDEREFLAAKQAIELMIKEGLLEIPGHKEWYLRWLNIFSTQVVCPTKLFLDMIRS